MHISDRHCQSNFAHHFYFHCLINFAKGIDLLCKTSLWCLLLRKRPIHNSKSIRWILSWWAKFESEFLLTIISWFKIQNHLQKRRLWMAMYQHSFQRKTSETCTACISVAISHFLSSFSPSSKFLLANSEQFGVLWWNHQTRFKILHSSPNTPKSRAYQSQACFLHTRAYPSGYP